MSVRPARRSLPRVCLHVPLHLRVDVPVSTRPVPSGHPAGGQAHLRDLRRASSPLGTAGVPIMMLVLSAALPARAARLDEPRRRHPVIPWDGVQPDRWLQWLFYYGLCFAPNSSYRVGSFILRFLGTLAHGLPGGYRRQPASPPQIRYAVRGQADRRRDRDVPVVSVVIQNLVPFASGARRTYSDPMT